MDETRFWQLVEATRPDTGFTGQEAAERHIEALAVALESVGPEDLIAFDRIFCRLHDAAYRWDLWGAAYLIESGCSDDDFVYFRTGLIAQGREVYERALADPETLAALPHVEDLVAYEEFAYVADEVYEQKTGAELPYLDDELDQPGEPIGVPFDEDTVADRFPRLAARFS
ncbi:MAG TPA: DUF4240 domain-containing protein [Cryptosporangiaceae bacterium]|nr:DUF4240 domain-containing protein [Cryptosporangiaceae bacterium]